MEIYLIFIIAYCETIKCNVYWNLYFFIVPFLVKVSFIDPNVKKYYTSY